MSNKNYIISQGHCRHLGATIEKDGVNFAVWAPDAAEIDLLLFDAVDDDSPYVVHLSSTVFKSTYFWHVFVHNIGAGQIYAYRVTKTVDSPQAQSQAEEINKILIDPYGMRVLFPDDYKRFLPKDEKLAFKYAPKSAVINVDEYDWGIDTFPHHSLENTIIYEMHVKGFTADKSSGLSDELRGTYKGLIEKIPYLVELGITAVELMPVYQSMKRMLDLIWITIGATVLWHFSQYTKDTVPIKVLKDL